MTMITPSYLGETIEYSSLHACRSTLEDPTLGEQDAWHRRHSKSDIPCPPRKVSVDVRSLPGFNLFELKHKLGVTWTVTNIVDAGGGQWNKKRAEVAIKWLNATYPPSDIPKHAEQQEEKLPSESIKRQALADEPDPADYPGFPWSGESFDTDQQSNALDSQGPAEFAESPGFPTSDESAEPPHDLTPDDLPELTKLPEPPDFQSYDEPMEIVVRADYSDSPPSD